MSVPNPRGSPPATEWRLHPFWARALLVLSIVAIVLPGLGSVAGLGRDQPAAERPEDGMADPPSASWTALAAWHAFTREFDDGFAFRGMLVRWQSAFRYVVLRVSPQPEVIRGRGGWLFYADNGGLDDYLNVTPFTADELDTWAQALTHTQEWLEARGITYVFVVAPDKHEIYPEQMPASLRKASATSRTDQLMAHLAAHTRVHAVDFRPALLAAKSRERIYHRTDSHWNDAGAVVATREILARLRRTAPGAPWDPSPLAPESFDRREAESQGMDLARMLQLEHLLSETRVQLVSRVPFSARVVEPAEVDPEFGEPRVVTDRAGGRRPRALVYRDSFGSALIPYLAEQFSRAVFLWEYDVDPKTVEAERPDVVIHEWASRRLHTRLPYDAFATAPRGRRGPQQ